MNFFYIQYLEITEEASKENAWQIFKSGIDGFTDDYFDDGRKSEIATVREEL